MLLSDDAKSLFCNGGRRHSFDFSSKGYINLAGSRGISGDSKDAVRARTDFLNKGYYEPIERTLVELLVKYKDGGLVIDAGCGEGYYTQMIAEAGYETVGIDLSKFAVQTTASRLGCKTSPHTFAAVASVFELPLQNSSADAVVSIFAPCAEEEATRVLNDNGILVVVWAGREHLMGLKRALYSTAYENDDRADKPQRMKLLEKRSLSYDAEIKTNEDVQSLFLMTPYYWRTSPSDKDKLSNLQTLTTKIDINFEVYKKEK